MTALIKVLIVGGYGTFGGRLADLLRDEPRLELLIAGRSLQRAASFCSSRAESAARMNPVAFDRDQDAHQQLELLAPHILVDASGPFQAYAAGGYGLIEACIALRVSYMDLSDGSDFVAGVARFDAAAKSAGVFVLSGVSSFPVLTAAVVRHLSAGMTRVISIYGGIAPSPYAGVGENVVRAIAGYAGASVPVMRGGRVSPGHPFTDSRRFVIAPPGRLPLRSTLFSLVDVPDLRVLPHLWRETHDIWMGAGPVPELLHRILIACAWLVRLRLLPSLSRLSGLMFWVVNHLRWGPHRGGMFVIVGGTGAEGCLVRRSWHLLAEGDDGPLIPSMAVEAIVRRLLAGSPPAIGARAAVNELLLADYERLFAERTIYCGSREETAAGTSGLFAHLLGDAWQQVPAAVRQLHTFSTQQVTAGRCTVDRGRGLLANCIASVFRFPKAARDLPVTVRFERDDDGERWTRTFGRDQVLTSTLKPGQGRSKWLLCERIGVFDFAQALVIEGDRLRLTLRRWSLFGLPLPLNLAPRSNSYESTADGRFEFHVEISLPVIGLLVRYRGWLSPVSAT